MAQRTTVQLVDDMDGNEAETTISFALDGVSYEIDLSAKNADAMGAALQRYIGAARRTGGRRGGASRSGGGASGGRRSDAGGSSSSAEVRAWAASQGIEINSRGRIPAGVQEQYDAAH